MRKEDKPKSEGMKELANRVLDSWIGKFFSFVIKLIGEGWEKVIDSRKVKQ